ncbi:MAG: SDR family NAD(P)-dependent oxidoreductase [Kofleriaceae bacterium]
MRTIFVTGSTDGVGRRVVEKLAAPGTHLIVHGRDAARGAEVVAAVQQAGASAEFRQADFASLDQVRRLADDVKHSHGKIDVLINNAGIALVSGARRLSPDGFELHFAVNYLAGFLLTHLLRPVLQTSRVVNVSSAGQQTIDFDDVMLERGYSGYRAYAQSKLAQILFTFDLAEDKCLTATCLHPSTYMDTSMVRNGGITPMSSVDTGADAIIAAINARNGHYFDVQRDTRANAQAYDVDARRRLRELSMQLVAL